MQCLGIKLWLTFNTHYECIPTLHIRRFKWKLRYAVRAEIVFVVLVRECFTAVRHTYVHTSRCWVQSLAVTSTTTCVYWLENEAAKQEAKKKKREKKPVNCSSRRYGRASHFVVGFSSRLR